MWVRTYRSAYAIVALAATLIVVAGLRGSIAQEKYTHGQTVVPAYEGFSANPDGTFDLVFGYLNRNYEELVDIPIGPANNIEPGGPDQGQPTHFLARRHRFEFRIRVPKDFGDKEVVWTLTSRGKTEKAYGTLKPDYILDNRVMMMNNSGFGQRGNEGDNQPPVVKVEGETRRTAKVGEPLVLSAVVTDDGMPAPPGPSDKRTASGGGGNTGTGERRREYGLRGAWYVYRRAGNVTFEPRQTVPPYPAESIPPPLAQGGRVSVRATFGGPGTYVLRVMGDDMGLQSVQDVTVVVSP
jgi:hypothetical protein